MTGLTIEHFNIVHSRLAEKGACDSTGGAEYERVLGEWLIAGKPSNVATFIRQRSNIPAGETP